MLVVHIDTWNSADPQKIIDLIPMDIRPFVVMNISLSISHNSSDPGRFNVVEYGYETARSWVRTCAQNRMWVMIQPSSGGFCHFSDFDLSIYHEFFQSYPNFLGFNYAEQFWGFDLADDNPPDLLSAFWVDRINHFANLLQLCNQYGGYLMVSWCGNQWSPSINPIGMLKRVPAFESASRIYKQNFILADKFTQVSYQSDMQSICLGAYLSGYAGNWGIRYDDTGWTDVSRTHTNFTMASAGPPYVDHIMDGATVIDGPELIWTQCFRELSAGPTDNGFTMRRWERFPQFDNITIDFLRKLIDGSVRIPTRQEVIDRAKVVIIADVNSGSIDDVYSSPTTLFEGLYRMDGDGNLRDNYTLHKKTGRYPTIPVVYKLADTIANSFQVKVNKSAYSARWPSITAKVNEFNSLFPSEYTGTISARRLENQWTVYNPFKVIGQTASANIPFKYNTCSSMELTFSEYTAGVITEISNKVSIYLGNFDNQVNNVLKTDIIKIYGATTEPTYSWADRGNHMASIVSKSWAGGVFTLTVQHNGPLDITINCAGSAVGRLTEFTPATVTPPSAPLVYTGPRQYEAEHFDYKNISGVTKNGYSGNIRNYTGQGYLNFGTSASASVRDLVTVARSGIYRLETRYFTASANVTSIDLYVNGIKVATPTFTQTPSLNEWGVHKQNILLNAGNNVIEFRSTTSRPTAFYFDNMVVVPTTYGDGAVIQESHPEFNGVDGTVASNFGGYTGPGYASATPTNGASVYWNVLFDASVTKAFTFRYAGTATRSADLFVNGSNVAPNIQFPATGTFTNWDYVTVYASVPEGSSEVKLRANTTDGLPNIDSLEVIGGTRWIAGTPPFTPQRLSATPLSTSEIRLSWRTVPGAATYEVKHATTPGGPYTMISTGITETNFVHSGLGELTTHYYVIRAANAFGESAESSEATATTLTTQPPPAPTGLNAVALGPDKADLSWTAAVATDSYIIKRALAPGGPFLTVALGVTGTTHQDTGLFGGKTYYYVVSGVNANGEGANSAVAILTTPTTLNLSPIIDTYVRDGGSAGNSFGNSTELHVKNDPSVGFTRYTFLKFDVTGLTNMQSAVLKLTPYQVDGNPTVAFELVTDDSWDNSITWNNPPSGSGNVAASVSGFVVGQPRSINVTTAAKNEALGDGIFSLKASQPIAGNTFIGFHSKESAIANQRPVLEITLSQNDPAPAAPANLVATAVYYNQINLTWNAVPGASSYNIRRAPSIGGPFTVIAAGVSDTAFSDIGLTENTTTYYTITAINGAGESPESPVASATTPDKLPPPAPNGLIAVGEGTNRIHLTWQSSPGAAFYNVRRAFNSGGPYTLIATDLIETSFDDIGLAVGAACYYVVTAVNELGEGLPSNEASAATASIVRALPLADAYVRNGGFDNSVFGNDNNLTVKTDDGATDATRITYIKFNVSGLSNVQNARLILTPTQVDGNVPLLLEEWTNDNWSENSITWNNQPAGSGTAITTISSYALNNPVQIDISNAVRNQASTDGVLTIRITRTGSSYMRIDFASKEHATPAFRPTLEYPLSPNTPPTLASIHNQTIGAGIMLSITNTATDSDIPAQSLTYSLSTAPNGATIDPVSGVLTWRPLVTQANTVNPFTVRVTDNGSPALSASQSFVVTVTNLPQPALGVQVQDGSFALRIEGANGPDYQIQASTNLVDWDVIFSTNAPAMPFFWTDSPSSSPSKFFRVRTGPPF